MLNGRNFPQVRDHSGTRSMKSTITPLLILFAVSTVGGAADRPNIVVFLVDDMGVMDTSVLFLTDESGVPLHYPLNNYYRTPNMERLAVQGIRFNNFYAMSVCSPTRVSIMTGQNAARHRVTNWINPDNNNRGPLGPPDWDWSGLDSGDVTLCGSCNLPATGQFTLARGISAIARLRGPIP